MTVSILHDRTLNSKVWTAPASAPAPPTDTSSPLQTYTSQAGGFSIQLPQAYVIYIEQRPSVDGVVAAFPNGIAILSPTAPNFLLGVEYVPFQGSLSLGDYILDDGCIQDPKLGQEILIDSVPGLLFPDARCGPYGSSILYLVRESMAYRFTVETHAAFQVVSASVMDLLSTIRWIDSKTATWDRSRVGEARLVSATEGWVLTEGSLLWTSDGGDTWREVVVPTASDDLI